MTSRKPTWRDETVIYRIWGEDALLLYIGISNNFGRRWREHAKQQPWWDEKRRLTVDAWFTSRAEAEDAEAEAIKAESPKYNDNLAMTACALCAVYGRTDPCMHLAELRTLSCPIDLGTAGRAFGFGRTKSHELARAGEFPCPVKLFGRRYVVLKADLLAALGIEAPSSAPTAGAA